jgi:cell division ATPase FtsA
VEREAPWKKRWAEAACSPAAGPLLPGMLDVAESQLLVKARTGLPVRLSHMPGELAHPGYSTAIGMLLYAHRTRAIRPARKQQFTLETARHLRSQLLPQEVQEPMNPEKNEAGEMRIQYHEELCAEPASR